MIKTLRMSAASALALAVAACAGQSAPPAAAPTGDTAPQAQATAQGTPDAPVSIYTGVYTAEQADRGDQTQLRDCSACHSPQDWMSGRVLAGFSGQTAYDLVNYLRNTMPLDAPGRLSMQQYTDIVAFMFEINDVPAGTTELAPDAESLSSVEIEYRP